MTNAASGTGLLIAAPSSGAGKTTLTLAILRALSRKMSVRGAKSGPDYIDPRFHEAACDMPCVNLDAWAVSPDRLRSLAAGPDLLIVEGAMGLFDGAQNGKGSAASLALHLGIPVVLVIDCTGMAQSVAAIARGFVAHDPDLTIAGLILNKVASAKHEAMLRHSLDLPELPPVLGVVPRNNLLTHPARHLGLVQAQEHENLDAWLDQCADFVASRIDLDALPSAPLIAAGPAQRLTPPGQRIAVARDAAFAFYYPHMLDDWRAGGGRKLRFSRPWPMILCRTRTSCFCLADIPNCTQARSHLQPRSKPASPKPRKPA